MSAHENGWKLTVMRKRQRSLERETRNHRVRGNLLHQGLEAVGLIINHNHRRKGKSKTHTLKTSGPGVVIVSVCLIQRIELYLNNKEVTPMATDYILFNHGVNTRETRPQPSYADPLFNLIQRYYHNPQGRALETTACTLLPTVWGRSSSSICCLVPVGTRSMHLVMIAWQLFVVACLVCHPIQDKVFVSVVFPLWDHRSVSLVLWMSIRVWKMPGMPMATSSLHTTLLHAWRSSWIACLKSLGKSCPGIISSILVIRSPIPWKNSCRNL